MADINGNWLGTYWQDEMPNRFEAAFVQSGNILSGSILDDNYLGEAQVSGRANASKLLLNTTKIENQRKNQDFSFDLISKLNAIAKIFVNKQGLMRLF
ncbi:MAG: hypothetical protein ICV54_29085 [Nostoc sp. C3-bin3]|nr:hypothetical protein [Nostoc sp. C3-bin3]